MSTPTVQNISTMSKAESNAFEAWYDAKSDDTQLLIDEISDRTYYIIDEEEYDSFIEELANYGINDASQFEDAFEREVEGHGERVFAEFSEELIESCGYTIEPEFIANCIDWELVWYSSLRYDYQTVEFKGNTYFFRNIWFRYDFYTQPWGVFCRILPTFFISNQMFFNPSNNTSSAIADFKASLLTNQVIVKFVSDTKSYVYNVDSDALCALFSGGIDSLGKFVNVWCKEEGDLVATINWFDTTTWQ